MMRIAATAIAFFGLIAPAQALGNELNSRIQELAVNQLSNWLDEPTLIEALRSQNEKHAGLSQSDIDSMDQMWRSQTQAASRPLIDDLMSRSASEYLRDQQLMSDGLVTEVFVMDNLGLNVAQSDPTSDYWQGDEAKFQETFGKGAGSIHIGDVELDESSGAYQVQVSMTFDDPDGGTPLGAVTFGITME